MRSRFIFEKGCSDELHEFSKTRLVMQLSRRLGALQLLALRISFFQTIHFLSKSDEARTKSSVQCPMQRFYEGEKYLLTNAGRGRL